MRCSHSPVAWRPRARALALYRKRWKIKTLFGALKSRGFNLEATHLTDPAKISTLVALLTLATVLACKAAVACLGGKPTRLKAHGRPARSLFAHGLDTLRKTFAPKSFSQALEVLLSVRLRSG